MLWRLDWKPLRRRSGLRCYALTVAAPRNVGITHYKNTQSNFIIFRCSHHPVFYIRPSTPQYPGTCRVMVPAALHQGYCCSSYYTSNSRVLMHIRLKLFVPISMEKVLTSTDAFKPKSTVKPPKQDSCRPSDGGVTVRIAAPFSMTSKSRRRAIHEQTIVRARRASRLVVKCS